MTMVDQTKIARITGYDIADDGSVSIRFQIRTLNDGVFGGQSESRRFPSPLRPGDDIDVEVAQLDAIHAANDIEAFVTEEINCLKTVAATVWTPERLAQRVAKDEELEAERAALAIARGG